MKKVKMFLIKFKIIQYIKFKKFIHEYRKNNKNNFTIPINFFDIKKVNVGKNTYGNMRVMDYGTKYEKLEIGAYCSIADNVTFLLGGEHPYKNISTYPIKNKLIDGSAESMSKGKIVISDDVWIGYGAIILSGTTIGQGAIIGAGSVVTGNIPPYAIYANGRIIKYRFEEQIISKLLKIDFLKIDESIIKNNIEKFYTEVTAENVDELIKKIGEKYER